MDDDDIINDLNKHKIKLFDIIDIPINKYHFYHS